MQLAVRQAPEAAPRRTDHLRHLALGQPLPAARHAVVQRAAVARGEQRRAPPRRDGDDHVDEQPQPVPTTAAGVERATAAADGERIPETEARGEGDSGVGEEAEEMRNMLEISYPVDKGIVQNWSDMEHLWDYTFSRMGVGKEEMTSRRILLTEPPLNPKQNREKLLQVMFDKYEFEGVNISVQAVLTLYAQGLMTGVVVDSGDGVTHIIPVWEGVSLPHLTRRMNMAGRNITDYMIKLLLHRGYAFNRSADFDTVRQIKESLAYVAFDAKAEQKLAEETTVLMRNYTLPDGRVISIGQERFMCAEALFQPQLLDMDGYGVGEELFNVIQAADMDLRADFYKHIVLSGGTTMLPGLPSRLEKEVRKLHQKHVLGGKEPEKGKELKLRIEDPPRRKHMVMSV